MKWKSRVYLRAFEVTDVERIHRWRHDPELNALLMGTQRFVSSINEREWIERAVHDEKDLRLAVCRRSDDVHIGNAYVTKIDLYNRHGEGAILIGDAEARNHGYAIDAGLLVLDFAFRQRGLERIYTHTLKEHRASRRVGRFFGFQEEGVLRRAVFKHGTFHDVVVAALLREDFEKVAQRMGLR